MKATILATTLLFAMCTAHAGVAPNTGASQMSQSGAKIAPSKKSEEQAPQGQTDQQQEKAKSQ